MNSEENKFESWVDMLMEKHECFDVGLREEQITIGARTITLAVPSYAPNFELNTFSQSDQILFLLLKNLEQDFDGKKTGIVAIATETEPDYFVVKLWHETYPWLFEKLGLARP